jgi:hypothetical protein
MAVDADPEVATEPPPAPPPESSEAPRRAVSDRGQELVAVPVAKRRRRAPKPPPQATREYESIDDVLGKYSTPSGATAARPDVHTPDDAVPPNEPDPARRDRATYGPIVLTPEAYDPDEPLPAGVEEPRPHSRDDEPPEPDKDKLRTIEDLCARFDLDGSGQFFIMVTRQQPRAYAGTATYGRMKNIVTVMDHDDFCLEYGGGQYMLQVYGPGKRGNAIDPVTRLPKKRALSKPIVVTIPWEGENAIPPNPEAASNPYEAEDAMHPRAQVGGVREALIGRRVNTLADAKMLETEVQKELTMDERQRQDRRENETERRREEQAALHVVRESKDETIRMQQGQIEELKKEIRQIANGSKSNGAEVVQAVAQMASALQQPRANEDELSRMKEAYEERLRTQRDSYEERLKDLSERYKREVEDRERVLMRDKEDGIRRAEEQARLAEQHRVASEQQLIKDRDREREDFKKDQERLKADQQREMDSLKRDHERDLARQKEQYENLLRAEKESNERERRTTEQLTSTKADLVKSTVESELRTATAEVTRLRADNDRLKAELDKKSNLPKQLKEFSDAAESLGFARDEGGAGKEEPATWQEILLKGGLTAMEKLPDILKNAGELLQARQNAARAEPARRAAAPVGPPVMLPPRERPAPPPMPPVTQPGPLAGWSTEDAPFNPAPMQEFYEPALPAARAPEAMMQPQPPPAMPPAAMRGPMPTPAEVAMAPSPSAPPPPPPRRARPSAVPSQAPAAASAPPAPAVQVSDEEILQFAPVVEEWLAKQEASPEDYARHAAVQLPILKAYAPVLTPEAIAAALRKNGKGLSPLIRRDGQRFLARFRAALLEEVEKERTQAP